jgi:hypothetical protein
MMLHVMGQISRTTMLRLMAPIDGGEAHDGIEDAWMVEQALLVRLVEPETPYHTSDADAPKLMRRGGGGAQMEVVDT